jgi:NAD(P)-dependent dehydrogenase (short-subunit alcohol dehydrogenase family)
MTGRVEGKVALVTGAGSIGPGWGNGKASSVLMAREGAKLACLDINADAAEETRAIIESEGGEAIALRCDVSKRDQVEAAVAATVERFGALDIVHHNVGIAVVGGPVELEEDEWDRVTDINLKSAYLVTRASLPALEQGGGGAAVFTSSIAGIRYTGVDYITYSTTKGALIPFSRSIALQYARRGVRSNCVLPGLMNTPMIYAGLQDAYADGDKEEMARIRGEQCPMGFMGDAWDVARAVLFLASDDARYVTATELVVDGGITAKFT